MSDLQERVEQAREKACEALEFAALNFDDQNYFAKWQHEFQVERDRLIALERAEVVWSDEDHRDRCEVHGTSDCYRQADLEAAIAAIMDADGP